MTLTYGSALHPLSAQRVLILFAAYSAPMGADRFADSGSLLNILAHILWTLRSTARSQHVRFYRDYYANPRLPQYMADVAREFAAGVDVNHLILVADPKLEAVAASASWAAEAMCRADHLRDAAAQEFDVHKVDAVVIVHPDPLGMGLGQLERSLLAKYPNHTFVLNGRRRFYRLDRTVARSLAWRRFLAETRVVEAFLSYALWPVGLALATSDAIFKRKSS